MLAVEVAFLTGRYVATAFDDRRRAEWPPHPARFFSALAATHFESLERSRAEREALEWMAGLGAPEIVATEAAERDVVTVFVPVNDTSVVSDLGDEAKALDEAREAVVAARSESPKARSAAEKKLTKANDRFVAAARRASAAVEPGKEGKDGPFRAASVLPEHRGRQPRTFPSVTPTAPRVVFVWPDADPSPGQRATLDLLSARVVRLGHSASLVSVRLCAERPDPTWVPDATGEVRGSSDERILRVVEAGQVGALEAMPRELADDPGRVMPAAFRRYVRPRGSGDERAPTTVFAQDWIVLRRIGGPRLPSVRTVDVARTVRRALLKAYGDGAPEILSGHRSPGEPSTQPHMAVVPLPFVGHDRADGSILGVAVVLPTEVTGEKRRAVYRAVDSWCKSGRHEDEGGLPVHLGKSGTLMLAVPDDTVTSVTLAPRTWCERASSWATATPIALDRNPGDLRSSDPAKEAAAYAQAEESIAASCERIGLPRPERVIALVAAPFAGGDKARHFPPFATGTPAIQRVLVHARITFDRPVEGPILLGAGRYFGLGLLRPVPDHG
jgi:CRISPR-associated protein Csb2